MERLYKHYDKALGSGAPDPQCGVRTQDGTYFYPALVDELEDVGDSVKGSCMIKDHTYTDGLLGRGGVCSATANGLAADVGTPSVVAGVHTRMVRGEQRCVLQLTPDLPRASYDEWQAAVLSRSTTGTDAYAQLLQEQSRAASENNALLGRTEKVNEQDRQTIVQLMQVQEDSRQMQAECDVLQNTIRTLTAQLQQLEASDNAALTRIAIANSAYDVLVKMADDRRLVVTLYVKDDFSGASSSFKVGDVPDFVTITPTLNGTPWNGNLNDAVHSMAVAPGYCAKMYRDIYYGGNSFSVTNRHVFPDDNSFRSGYTAWSSMKVTKGDC